MATLDEIYKHTEEKMQKALEATRGEFVGIRTGRASIGLVDRLHVEAYGTSVPLKQVASVSTPDPRTLQISAFDRTTNAAKTSSRSFTRKRKRARSRSATSATRASMRSRRCTKTTG